MTFEEYKSGDVTFTAAQQAAAFDAFINQDDYLSTRRGQYAERNGVLMPMLSTIDLSVVQDFSINVSGKKNTLQLRADVFNFGNMISDKLGVGDRIVNTSPLQLSKITDGVPVYKFSAVNGALPTTTYVKRASLDDVWQAQLGVRYIFN